MWVSILPRKNSFLFFSLLTRRPFLPRPITGKMRIYKDLCFFNWEHPGLDCARAWTAHGPGLRTGLDCARACTAHGPGLRTGLDFARAWTAHGPGLRTGLDCARAWTAHGPGLRTGLDCARAWTAHGPGLRTGLDWDIRTGRQKDEKWAWPGVASSRKVPWEAAKWVNHRKWAWHPKNGRGPAWSIYKKCS